MEKEAKKNFNWSAVVDITEFIVCRILVYMMVIILSMGLCTLVFLSDPEAASGFNPHEYEQNILVGLNMFAFIVQFIVMIFMWGIEGQELRDVAKHMVMTMLCMFAIGFYAKYTEAPFSDLNIEAFFAGVLCLSVMAIVLKGTQKWLAKKCVVKAPAPCGVAKEVCDGDGTGEL